MLFLLACLFNLKINIKTKLGNAVLAFFALHFQVFILFVCITCLIRGLARCEHCLAVAAKQSVRELTGEIAQAVETVVDPDL